MGNFIIHGSRLFHMDPKTRRLYAWKQTSGGAMVPMDPRESILYGVSKRILTLDHAITRRRARG